MSKLNLTARMRMLARGLFSNKQMKTAKRVSDFAVEVDELTSLLSMAWSSIQDAGFEDHCPELKDKIDKYI